MDEAVNNAENDIIPANDARSIHGLEIVWHGYETEIGQQPPLYDNNDGRDESGEDSENDEEDELLDRKDLMPVSLQFKKLKVRWILNLTGNFSKVHVLSKHGYYMCTGIQISIIAILITYMAFTFGWMKNPKEWPTLITADGDCIFTKVHDVIWELKWLLSYIFGLSYMRSGHLQWFFSQLRLPYFSWRKSKRHGFIYVMFVSCMLIIGPTFNHGMKLHNQLNRGTHYGNPKAKYYLSFMICTVFYFLFRFITVPSFCAITAILYLIKVQIDSLGRTLKNLNFSLGLPYAKREICYVKKIIRKTDSRMKWFLLLHLVLILLTAFTGLLSLLEQFELKVSYGNTNKTTVEYDSRKITMLEVTDTKFSDYKIEIAQIYKRMNNLRANITKTGHREISQVNNSNKKAYEKHDFQTEMKEIDKQLQILTLKSLMNSEQRKAIIMPARNSTTLIKQGPAHLLVQLSKAKVLLASLTDLAEVLALFILPLLLLVWHERALKRIKDEIKDLDEEEQRRMYLLISNDVMKKDILNKMEEMHGVSIFGLQISLYKAALLAVIAPFMTAILHAFFKQYKLY